MKIYKKIAFGVMSVLVGIQFIPTARNQSDVILSTDFTRIFKVPSSFEETLKVSCYDCHSNNTQYPWYNKVQPINWFLENHISEAKEELNFSEFGNYSKRKQRSKLKSIMSQIRDDEMPLSSYTLMHQDARILDEQKNEIIQWMTNLRDKL